MKKQIVRLGILTAVLGIFVFFTIQMMTKVDATQPAELIVQREGGDFVLSTKELGAFHRTTRQTSDARLINLPNSNGKIITWNEQENDGRKVPVYAISLDGETVSRVQETSFELMLRYHKFDPLISVPEMPDSLSAKDINAENGTYIVQFVTQPLEEYRTAVRALGGKDYIYLANHAYLVMMNAETREKVENLPFVRWVGRYQPAYKLEEFLVEGLTNDNLPKMRYNIMVLERGRSMQDRIAQKIRALGGQVDLNIPEGFRLEATLTKEQLSAVANENEILFIDRWSAPENDMDIVRSTGGANFIESTLGFKGEGVSAEVMDGGLLTTHNDFQSPTVITHGPAVVVDSHGTATYGIVFGTGTANPAGRGMLPNAARKIIASYNSLTNRYNHTAELKQEPYKAVFQSNSWGNALTTAYTTISAEMDDILFRNDFVLLNSQSNNGNQLSRPQAWAKNVVSIGGVNHRNTATFDDDGQSGASIGPAADGRIKPDLAHFYDSVMTTTSTSTTAYTTSFGGTSAATPITAGHFGIFFQMWHNGLFGNPTRSTVFDSQPHMTTTKAIMINTAAQWSTGAPNNLLRIRQGWGRADLQNLYRMRNSLFIVDETHVLTNLQSRSYTINVSSPERPLKATMVYADPMGNPAATRARINDLTLKVTSPTGTVYWGNNGMLTSPWTTSGGTANVVDTVENVFIQNPEVGNWTVEVMASEIVQDARLETPEVDADFALVVSVAPAARTTQFDYDGDNKADVSVFRPTGGLWYLQRSQSGFSALQFGIETDRIVPADYDGDGKTDVAVFRNNLWYLLRSTAGLSVENFGLAGDIPVPGDWDGDGKADLAVYRNGTGGGQSTFYYRGSANNPNGNISFIPFGTGGDVPVASDFDGDGKMDAAIFRPSDRVWYILQSQTGTLRAAQFGFATDKLVPADYDGDGKTDIAVYRDGTWYLQRSTAGFTALQFGLANDVPTPADYDGDGKADTAVYRSGVWYLLGSTNGFSAVQFGVATDRPTEAAYVR